MKLLNLVLCIATVGAFAPRSSIITKRNSPHFASDETEPALNSNLSELQNKLQNLLGSINADGLTENLDAIKSNVISGELGSRGETYAVAQLLVLGCILGGGVPFAGDAAMFLLGPGLLFAGAGVIFVSVNDLGDSLSPWPVPSGNGLKTGGLYAEMRHPTYAGLLAACAGGSIVTDSATRLLLTALLFYSLDVKSDYEEEELLMKYPEYATYQATVTSKFFPESIINQLPWMKNKE